MANSSCHNAIKNTFLNVREILKDGIYPLIALREIFFSENTIVESKISSRLKLGKESRGAKINPDPCKAFGGFDYHRIIEFRLSKI